MGDRKAAEQIALRLTIAILAGACGPESEGRIAIGAPQPAMVREHVLAQHPEQPDAIVWLLRTADYPNCQDFTYQLRQAQQGAAKDVLTYVIHVGGLHELPQLRAMLLRERLTITDILTVSPRTYRRKIGNHALPAWYLASGGKIAAGRLIDDIEGIQGESLLEALERVLPGRVGATNGDGHSRP